VRSFARQRGLLSVGCSRALGRLEWHGVIVIALNVAYDIDDVRPVVAPPTHRAHADDAFSVFTLVALLLLVFGERIGEAWRRGFG